jgi:outer membrane protein assembly factor BamB
MKNIYFRFCVILLFLLIIVPLGTSTMNDSNKLFNEKIVIKDVLNSYDCYSRYVYPHHYQIITSNKTKSESLPISEPKREEAMNTVNKDFKNSSWPMQSHDIFHTGRSPYNTIDNFGQEIWIYRTNGWASCSPTIDKNETIYIGAYSLYAINHNGTLKWKYDTIFSIESAPTIDNNGTIYFGTIYGSPSYLYAVYSNGTLKWKYPTGSIFSSPVITNDGTIIFADSDHWKIIALYPNGTKKWEFHTNMVIYSSPAIGLDGTIFCGSHDHNVYALNPNNGTLKWVFVTGDWVHGSPTVGSDGTVYIGSDDGYLYALHPNNGTMKWQCNIGASYASPTVDKDGTLYIGVWENEFYAIYPNGTIKWSIDPGAHVWGSSAALSDEGTLYFGTCNLDWTGGIEIIALNTNGTVKWRKGLDTVFSSPAIGSDGTVYIGSNSEPGLYAFGAGPLRAEANGPYTGMAGHPVQLTGNIYGGIPPYTYHWGFGDGQISDKQNPTHNYTIKGNYTATFTVTDSKGNTSSDTAPVTITYAPPSITITKPENAFYIFNIKTIPLPHPVLIGPITINVDAKQEPLGINRVEFFIDGELKATDTEAPYQWTWNTPAFFKHTIRVIAYDASGKSTSISIGVSKFF